MRTLVIALAAAMIVAGCFGGSSNKDAKVEQPDDVPVAQRPVTSNPLTGYLHNLSQPIAGVNFTTALVEQYRTPIDEVMELDTWIARPNFPGKVPIVVEVTPYYGGGKPTGLGRVGLELIQRGYAVGVSSVRGTGQSGGCFSQGGVEEALDTAKVVEHLAGLEWSNGNVGIMGVSYPGTTPQDVWVEAPPSLKTIVPISGISDLYKYNFVHGVHINPQGYAFNAYYWALEGPTAGTVADLDPEHSATAAAGEVCPEQAAVQEGGASSALDGNKDAYWKERDFLAELRASWDKNPERASVWYVHGLQDWNVKPHMMEDWLPAIVETGVPYKILLGQWPHAWPQSTSTTAKCDYDVKNETGPACRADWWQYGIVAWFDYFLKGIDTGILDAPRVQIQDDQRRWHHEQVWPPVDATRHVLRLTADGKLDSVGGTGIVSYSDTRGTGILLPIDNAPGEARWRSEPFAQEWTISGFPVFHANVTASGARANLILTLAEERKDGTLRSINFCAQSLNHVKSLEAGQTNIAGIKQEVHFLCFPQDDVISAGSRILVIASGNTQGSPAPGFQPLASGSVISIDVAGAWMEFPVDHSITYEDPQPYGNLLWPEK